MIDSPPVVSATTDIGQLAAQLAQEMAVAWHLGERTRTETYLERYSELQNNPEEAIHLIYEEFCLSQELGEELSPDELYRRFPEWTEELRLLLDAHELVESHLEAPMQLPSVGEMLGDFRLVAELGRGTQGRVFLATQTALADRPVVLKVMPRCAREHLSLAHLQHTHIIPLHALYDFPKHGFQAMCMPFLGGTSLAYILDRLGDLPAKERSGQAILHALDSTQRAGLFGVAGQGGYRQLLTDSTYVQAICHIGIFLAEGLHHAHKRGLLHLDLKPSNVLLAADAQPLLLDFHLARQPLAAGEPAPDWFGGTPEYMSPEQEEACSAARLGRPLPLAVDERSDIYSLGRLLYAALAGASPGTERALPPLHEINPRVSVGFSDLIHKCLALKPNERYPSAAALAADLRRHLTHEPLRGVPNRDWRERWQKWRRRRPNASLWIGLILALLGAGAALTTATLERYRGAQAALSDGQDQIRRGAYREAVQMLARAKARANGLPGVKGLSQAIDRELNHARRAQTALDFHAVAESLRFIAGAEVHSADELRALEVSCRTAWQARDLLTDHRAAPLDASTEEQIRADLLDFALLWADLTQRLTPQPLGRDGRRQAQTILSEAEELLGPRPALAQERQTIVGSQGLIKAIAPERLTYWEHIALGQSFLRCEQLERAAEELDRAIDLCPQSFWANFYRGVCAYRSEEYDAAVHSFGVAIALSPNSPECYYNRALAHAALGENARALHDYDKVLELASHLATALLNRGVLHYEAGRLAQARADLEKALAHGADPPTCHFNLALVHQALDEPVAAEQHVDLALARNPAHAEAQALRKQLRRTHR